MTIARVLGVAAFVACGSSHNASDAPPVDHAQPMDAACFGMTCDGTCVDINTDPMHCGSCTNACSGATPSCAGGTCHVPHATTWVTSFGGSAFGYSVTAVAIDVTGNVYIAGSMLGTIDLGGGPLTSTGGTDILVASFTPTGAHRWSKRFGGSMNDQGASIVATDTHVYVTGAFTGAVDFGGGVLTSAGRSDVFVLTLRADTAEYASAWEFGEANDDVGLGIVADPLGGDVTVCGTFGTGTIDLGGGSLVGAGTDNAFVASFDATGRYRWSRMLAGAAGTINSCQAIAIKVGNIIVAGVFQGTADFGNGPVTSAGGFDAFVATYNGSGAPSWTKTFGGVLDEYVYGVALDLNSQPTVAGNFRGAVDFGTGAITANGVVDGFVLALDAKLDARWVRQLAAATSGDARAVAVDNTNNVLVSGEIEGACDLGTGPLAPLGNYDVFVAEFAGADGATRFARRLGGADFEEGNTIAAPMYGGPIALGGYFRSTVDLGTGPIVGGAQDNGFVLMIAP